MVDPRRHAQDGPWQILSVAEAGSHRFDYCAAEATFDGGIVLTIERDRAGRAVLVLQTGTPSFAAGTRYDVHIAVGLSLTIAAAGHASGANTLALPLEPSAQILAALARSRSLKLDLSREVEIFALNGADTAMADLERCFQNAVKPEALSGRGLVETVLDRAETGPIQEAHPAGSTERADRDYAWSKGPVAGGAREIPIGARTMFLDLVLTRLDRLAARCRGRFTPELEAPVETGGGVIEAGIGICREAAGDRLAALLYLRSGDRFVEFVFEAPAENRTAATADRDHIAAIVRTIILIH